MEFAVGEHLHCTWRDDVHEPCEVIERRQSDGIVEYYIHYLLHNSRLDEWVLPERLLRHGTSVERKRKAVGAPQEIEEFHPATRHEHGAATRVKNIEKIVLGKWEIHTWCARQIHPGQIHSCTIHQRVRSQPDRYYSPFPTDYAECETLHFCEFDLHFCKKRAALERYMKRCTLV